MTQEQREAVVAAVFVLLFLGPATVASVVTGNWDWLLCFGIALGGAVLFACALTAAAAWVERGR